MSIPLYTQWQEDWERMYRPLLPNSKNKRDPVPGPIAKSKDHAAEISRLYRCFVFPLNNPIKRCQPERICSDLNRHVPMIP